jgi:histidinol-phosphate aminotransferase
VQRRAFFQTSLAAGLAGAGLAAVPSVAHAGARRQSDSIRLSSNENPLGLGPKARQAVLDALVDANRYPGAVRRPLIERLASRHGVTEGAVVLGCGSTEVLRVAVHGLDATRVVVANPTYEDVESYAGTLPASVHAVPLRADRSHDIPRMRALADEADGPVVIFLCNPNNPTGTLTSSDEIDTWIAGAPDHHYFLVDEAYFHFVDDPSYHTAIPWVHRRANVLVARTFSKVYGMAGLRLGYGVAHPDLAARLNAWSTRNNGSYVACAAGLASLTDPDFVEQSLAVNRQARTIARECLDDLGLTYFPSHTNFMMHEVRGDLDTYRDRMREHGILVGRKFPPLLGHNRVSMGLPSEMDRWAETLRTFRKEGWV